MDLLLVPNNKVFSIDEVRKILSGTSLPSLIKDKISKQKGKRPQQIPLTALQPKKKTARKMIKNIKERIKLMVTKANMKTVTMS